MSAYRPSSAPCVSDDAVVHDRPPPVVLAAAGPPARPPGGTAGASAASGAGGSPRGAPPMGQYGILHVIGGNDRGKQCELGRVVTNIGRGADQDLVLADIAVSRRHIKIHLVQNGYRLQDLGSGNGTLINGKRVEEAQLVDGDQIELGNTLLRFEHPPSRAQEAAPPPAFAPPPPAYPPPQPFASAAAPVMPVAQPFASAAAPVMPVAQPFASAAAPVLAPPAGGLGGGGPSFLATERGRRIAFPALGLGLLIGLGGLAFQLGRPAPQGSGDAALKHYVDGTRHFTANDYDAARKSFQAALQLAPESPELRRYLEACDIEAEALGYISAGRKELEGRRYGEALRAFEKVEKKSVQYDYAQQQARDARREAAKTALTKAQELARVNPEGAKQVIQEGLEIDPDDPGLLALRAEVNAGTTVPVLPKDEDEPPRPKAPAPAPPPRPKAPASKPAEVAQAKKADPPKRPERQEKPTPAAEPIAPGADLTTNKAALISYRSRDFGAAINAMQNFAKVNRGATQQRAQATIRDLEQMRSLLDKAGKLEGTNPAGALATYNDAAALDRRIAGGALGPFISGKTGPLQARVKGAPAPRPGPTPVPPPASGADPATVAKADQLLGQARAQMARNPSGAKLLCRQAMQLFGKNVSHPKYQEAYRLLTSIKGKDDDED